MRKDYRDADTIEIIDHDFAKLMWQRLKLFFDGSSIHISQKEDVQNVRWQRDLVGKWLPTGTNHNLLIGRYHEHGHFAPHTDGYSITDFNHRSMYSIVIYLNTIPKGCGGGTCFYHDSQKGNLKYNLEQKRYVGQPEHKIGTVNPIAGRAAIFFHNHMHEGVPPQNGQFIINDIYFCVH